MRYRLEVRVTAADVGRRVIVRWRRPAAAGTGTAYPDAAGTGTASTDTASADVRDEVADVLGILEAADDTAFTVRKASGELVVIPLDRALAAKTIPPARPRPT